MPIFGARSAHHAELGGQDEAVSAPSAQRSAQELFVGVRSVHVGRVEKCHPQFERAVDGGERLIVVSSAVEIAHSHAPQAAIAYCPHSGSEE